VTPHADQKGFTIWFTGLSGAGKSTLAEMLFHELRRRDMKVELLDGDIVRTNLSKGLGFSKDDRDTNILRIGFVANLLTRNGVATIVSAISPYREARGQCRAAIQEFVEIFVHATVDECAKRDVKGLYAKALAGEITGFTGVDDPYEPPQSPEIYIDTMNQSPDESLDQILNTLSEIGYIQDSSRLVHQPQAHSGLTDLDHARRNSAS
jgi:adenylylsulfate kinase